LLYKKCTSGKCLHFLTHCSSIAHIPDYHYHFCLNDKGIKLHRQQYVPMRETSIASSPSSLYSNTEIDYGFYNSSYGQNSDKVYAIGFCRGDVHVNLDDCRGCLNITTSLLKKHCPNQKETIGWLGDRLHFTILKSLHFGR